MKIKLGVIFGGESVEHEVSIISALQAMEHLNAEKYDIIPIYISKDRTFYCGKMLMDMDVFKNFDDLKKYAKKVTFVKKGDKFFLQKVDGLFRKDITDIDIVLPIVHGNNVEDGSIQGQDKVVMKQVFASAKLPIVDYTWFYDNEYSESKEEILKNIQNLGYPVVVKPATLGSSVGITYVEAEEKVRSAIEEAIKYDKKIIVEKAVDNLMEVNCSVLGNYMYQEVSALEEVMSEHNLLTYADKYIGGSKGKLKGGFKRSGSKGMASASRVIPARISSDLETEIKDLSKKVFNVLNLSGLCRIDYLIDKKANKVYVNEPNTIPGSLAFYLWEPIGKSYDQLLDDMINLSIKEYKQKLKKTYSFDTNILSNYNGIKGAKGKLKR